MATTMCCGALSGFAQVLAEQPFDTIKVRLQSRALTFDAFGGPAALARTTWRNEGARAFFQGVTPRLATYSGVKASLFYLFERLRADFPVPVAGAVAGGLNTALSCPQDVLKSRLQVQVASPGLAYLGPVATARDLLRRRGVAAFYAGWRPLVCRDVPGYAILYTVFVRGRDAGAPPWLCGGLSGVAFYLSTLPVDRVKTVMMTQPLDAPTFRSASGAAAELWRAHGAAGFYRGCAPTLARTACGQAVALTVYDRATAYAAEPPR